MPTLWIVANDPSISKKKVIQNLKADYTRDTFIQRCWLVTVFHVQRFFHLKKMSNELCENHIVQERKVTFWVECL